MEKYTKAYRYSIELAFPESMTDEDIVQVGKNFQVSLQDMYPFSLEESELDIGILTEFYEEDVTEINQQYLDSMNNMKKKPKCHWCDNDATKIDYREVDGMTSKIITCDECFTIDTKSLIKNSR